MSDSARRRLAVWLAAALAVAAYVPSLSNGWTSDALPLVERAAGVETFADVRALFADDATSADTIRAGSAVYRPTTVLTLALDLSLFGRDASRLHAMQVAWHALAALIFAGLLVRVLRPAAAFLGATLFALHPVHVATVASLAGRAEVVAACAVFAALLLYVSATEPLEPGPGLGDAVLLAALYPAAVLAHESAIVLPAFVFIVDAARDDIRFRDLGEYFARRAFVYGALAVGATIAIAARYAALGPALLGEPAAAFGPDASFPIRLYTMLSVWPHYVRLLVAPIELSPDYSPAVFLPQDTLSAAGAIGLGLVLALFALAFLAWRRVPWALAGPFWVAAALLPASNLLFPGSAVLHERLLFLASAGVALSAAGLLDSAFRSRRAVRILAWAPGLAAAAAFATLTVREIPVYASAQSVAQEILQAHPESYRGHWLRGRTLAAEDRRPEALAAYQTAVELWPHDARVWIDLARLNARWDRKDAAVVAARRAVEAAPGDVAPRRALAEVLLAADRPTDARTEALHGLAAVGHDPALFRLIAEAHRREERPRAAARALRVALEQDGWDGWVRLAALYREAGRSEAAFAALDTAGRHAGRDRAAHDSIESLRLRWLQER